MFAMGHDRTLSIGSRFPILTLPPRVAPLSTAARSSDLRASLLGDNGRRFAHKGERRSRRQAK